MDVAKRATGRQEYEPLTNAEEEEERRRSIERRQRETPSAIYAHKTIDVSLVPSRWADDVGYDTGFRNVTYDGIDIFIPLFTVSSVWTKRIRITASGIVMAQVCERGL